MTWKTILALGDSLTVGFQASPGFGNPVYTPYTEILQNLLQSSRKKVLVLNKGINGDTTSGMVERFDRSVRSEKPDYILIWAGINDLYCGLQIGEIVSNIKVLFEKSLSISSIPISCSLTPVQGSPHMNVKIQELNQLMRYECYTKKILFIDLYGKTADNNGRLKAEYSSDGVHLSNKGYRAVAERIYECITDLF